MGTKCNYRIGLMASVIFVTLLASCSVARADGADGLFDGNYAVGNWSTTLSNTVGGMDTSQAPISVTLTDLGEMGGGPSEILFSITVPSNAHMAFSWNYVTNDCCGAIYDPAGFEIDGNQFQLSPFSHVEGLGSSGVMELNLLAGQTFGFYADSVDDISGPASLTISGAPTAVPEPSSLALLAFGLLGVILFVFNQNRKSDSLQPTRN